MSDEAIAKSARAVAQSFWNRISAAAPAEDPLVLIGDPRSAELAELPDGNQDLLEFILNHEEIVFFLKERTFHICREHAQARAVLRRGEIPARFRCTLRGEDCPMRVISLAADERRVPFSLEASCR